MCACVVCYVHACVYNYPWLLINEEQTVTLSVGFLSFGDIWLQMRGGRVGPGIVFAHSV